MRELEGGWVISIRNYKQRQKDNEALNFKTFFQLVQDYEEYFEAQIGGKLMLAEPQSFLRCSYKKTECRVISIINVN